MFQLQKRGMGYARVIHEKKKVLKKWTQKCPRYKKQWVLRCPHEKERKRKITHVFLQKYFKVSNKRDMFQGA